MKKLVVMLLVGLFLTGCVEVARESGFWENDSMYKNWDHMKFSISGYKNPSKAYAEKSAVQNWWGNVIELPPGE